MQGNKRYKLDASALGVTVLMINQDGIERLISHFESDKEAEKYIDSLRENL